MMSKTRVVLADDHDILLDGLKRILEPEVDVVATAQDGLELVERVRQFRPEIVLIDISMPRLNGMDAFKKVKTEFPLVKFIFLTGNADVLIATHAIRLGAYGYVLKQSAADELLASVRAAKKSQTYITPRIAREVFQNLLNYPKLEDQDGPQLTLRERQVLQLLAEGKTLKEAATVLDVSPRTVEFHRNNIAQKTGLGTIAELARYASRQGLV